ncbi:GTPase HflX [Candidatus Peregrinibacteria bacterium]|nr:GTPase HflX [Candidatus Peregrinibacteria bacterium]
MKKIKAILVDVVPPELPDEEEAKRLNELESLVKTFGGISVVKIIQKRSQPDYRTYIGKGKVNQIHSMALENEAKLVVVNNIMKPGQIYNINEIFEKDKIEVWDRVDLILKIFEKHAKSSEAKLQVELAGIKHFGPRIYGMGKELARQEGAVGVRAGSGEANIEMMKRHLRRQELKIKKKLEHYSLIKKGHRKRRKRLNFKTVALVGYTNSGKSTLLNALTGKDVYIADELFATLDTRVGKIYIQPDKPLKDGKYNPGTEILISDTIGFIRDLPPELIEAFKSTLAETVESDLILHVIDVSDKDLHKKIQVVEEILNSMGLKDKPRIYVFNKMDLIKRKHLKRVLPQKKKKIEEHGILKAGAETMEILGWGENDKIDIPNDPAELKQKYQQFNPIFISAHKKDNLEELIDLIAEKVKN